MQIHYFGELQINTFKPFTGLKVPLPKSKNSILQIKWEKIERSAVHKEEQGKMG
jgi:hypothetical protein